MKQPRTGSTAATILDADLPRIASAIEKVAEEMHTANLIALASTPPLPRYGTYTRRKRAMKKAANRLDVAGEE